MQRKVDICGLQEVIWRSASVRFVGGKDSRYDVGVGNDKDMSKKLKLLMSFKTQSS